MSTSGPDRRTLLVAGLGLLAGCTRPPSAQPGAVAAGDPTWPPPVGSGTTPDPGDPSPAATPNDRVIPTASARASAWTFRAMTYNILSGARPPSAFPRVQPSDLKFENRAPVLAEWIMAARPDVLAVQENEPMRAPIRRPLRRLLPLLDGYRAVQPNSDIPILYRASAFEVLDSGLRVISRKRHVRYGSWCRLRQRSSGQQVVVANTHLDPHQSAAAFRAREASLEVLTDWLRAVNVHHHLPTLLMGDFNTPFEFGSDGRIHGLGPLYEAGLRNSEEIAGHVTSAVPGASSLNSMGAVVNGSWRYGAVRRTGTRMDYIWVGPEFTVDTWQVVTGPGVRKVDGASFFANGPVPSDHNPVLAEVSLPLT